MQDIKVPFFDWAGLYRERGDEFTRIIESTLSRGGFILQNDVDEFEENLQKFLGIKHVVALADCTNAMLLGLRACNLEPGSEIILPSHGFIAAAQSIHFANCVPVPVELNDHDCLINVDSIRNSITSKTRGIMPVHVNGRVCDMDPILEIAEKFNLQIFEDAAQAVGARYKGSAAAAFGQWGSFSFYPSKTLGCFGDAGALATNNDEIADAVKRMRNHGANADKTIPLDCDVWGTNCRLDNMHAAILNYKLTYYQETIDRRREIATRYHEAFSHVKNLRLPPPPDHDDDHYDIYQNYEIRCLEDRDGLRNYLTRHNIGTIIQWGGFGMHQLTGLGLSKELPKTDEFFRESLLLPMNHILSDEQVSYVIDKTLSFFQSGRIKTQA